MYLTKHCWINTAVHRSIDHSQNFVVNSIHNSAYRFALLDCINAFRITGNGDKDGVTGDEVIGTVQAKHAVVQCRCDRVLSGRRIVLNINQGWCRPR